MTQRPQLSIAQLHQLTRLNTPTIYNGWEQVTRRDIARDCFNLEEVRDFMPQMGPMAGYAVTLVSQASDDSHKVNKTKSPIMDYLRYVAEQPGQKILVIQDQDKPQVIGCALGEMFSNIHRALGCVGAIVDGGVRDVDEMCAAGFKVLAKRLAVGHGHVSVVRWNCPVQVFGQTIMPGQLVHADKHGYLAIPPEDEAALLDASRKMDTFECEHIVPAVRDIAGLSREEVLKKIEAGVAAFGQNVRSTFAKKGEW